MARYFNLEEARALVPRVRTKLGDALQLHSHLRLLVAELGLAGQEMTWALLRGEEELYAHEEGTDGTDGMDGMDGTDGTDGTSGGDPPGRRDELDAEMVAMLERARMIYRALRDVVESIESLGVEVKGVLEGLVDFHSFLDGDREVLLCWKLGERTVGHYHELETGFAGRKPIEGHFFTGKRESREASP